MTFIHIQRYWLTGDKDAFDTLLNNFYTVITETDSGPTPSGHDGALLFAVCRGKVSEGMDFTGVINRLLFFLAYLH